MHYTAFLSGILHFKQSWTGSPKREEPLNMELPKRTLKQKWMRCLFPMEKAGYLSVVCGAKAH